MNRRQQKKRYYIGINTIVLLLLIIIGVLLYNQSPRANETKDADNANPAPPSFTNGDEDKKATAPQPVRLCTTNLNATNIGNAGLLGVFGWLIRDYKKQLRTNNNNTFRLSHTHYILATVVLAAMAVYIGYFFYQNYLVHKVPSYSLRKDGVIFALMSFLTSFLINVVFYFTSLEQVAQEKRVLSKIVLFIKILMSLIASGVIYGLAIKGIESFKSNHKIKLFDPEDDSMWIFSIVVLTTIFHIIDLSKAYTIPVKLLWAIPTCFLYVQAYWYPQLLSSSNGKIAGMIAYLFRTSHLWEGLGGVLMVYHVGFSSYKVIGLWITWECLKYALDHLDIKKISDEEGYTASFPLGFTVLLEGAFMILFVAFGFCFRFWPAMLATQWTKILYGASVLAAGLWISLYFIAHQRGTIVQWAGLLSYGLLSLGGSVVAGYYVWNSNNNKAIAGGSLLVFGLYLVPKFFNLIATASLALRSMPLLQKIAYAIQDFTAFWLQLNLDVVCTAIVMGVGGIYTYGDRLDGLSQIGMICLVALATYLILEVICYHSPTEVKIAGVLAHMVFGVALVCIVALLGNHTTRVTFFVQTLSWCACYLAAVVWIQSLLNIVGPKGYRKRSLPASCRLAKEDLYAIVSTWGFVNIPIYIIKFTLKNEIFTNSIGDLLTFFAYVTLKPIISKTANQKGIIISWCLTVIQWLITASWYAHSLRFLNPDIDVPMPNFVTAKRLVALALVGLTLGLGYLGLTIVQYCLITIAGRIRSYMGKKDIFTLAKGQDTLHAGYTYVSQRFLRGLVALKARMHSQHA